MGHNLCCCWEYSEYLVYYSDYIIPFVWVELSITSNSRGSFEGSVKFTYSTVDHTWVKNNKVAADYEGHQQSEVNLFKATVEALELDGIHLLNPEKAAQEEAQVEEEASSAEPQVTRRLSLKEIFAMERERTSNLSDKTPSDDNIK